jgi:hypothetical protein
MGRAETATNAIHLRFTAGADSIPLNGFRGRKWYGTRGELHRTVKLLARMLKVNNKT